MPRLEKQDRKNHEHWPMNFSNGMKAPVSTNVKSASMCDSHILPSGSSFILLCRKKYAVPKSGGTGSLNNHLDRDHKTIFDSAKKTKNGNGVSTLSSSTDSHNTADFQITFNAEKITSEKFRHKLVKFMICCDEPLTLTENEYFRDLMSYMSGGNEECKMFCQDNQTTCHRSLSAI